MESGRCGFAVAEQHKEKSVDAEEDIPTRAFSELRLEETDAWKIKNFLCGKHA